MPDLLYSLLGPNDRGVWVFLFGIMMGVWYNLTELLFCLTATTPTLVGAFMGNNSPPR
jgi:hypothetical protein